MRRDEGYLLDMYLAAKDAWNLLFLRKTTFEGSDVVRGSGVEFLRRNDAKIPRPDPQVWTPKVPKGLKGVSFLGFKGSDPTGFPGHPVVPA